MTNEDVIRMAQEAGLPLAWISSKGVIQWAQLERFAHLVYEATFRDANIAASKTILDAAVLEEREACAKVCDEFESDADPDAGLVLAATIRARSKE